MQELEQTYGLSLTKLENGGLKIYTTIQPRLMAGWPVPYGSISG